MAASAWVALGIVVMLAPLVCAGSQDEPEVRDDPGDADYAGLVPMPGGPVGDAVDILAVWVDGETADSITLSMAVKDAAGVDVMAADPEFDQRYYVRFETTASLATGQYWFVARYIWGLGGLDRWFLWTYDADGEDLGEVEIAGSLDLERSVFVFPIPRAALDSPAAGTDLHILNAGASANPTSSAGLFHFGDYAGIDGSSNYTFQQGSTSAPADATANETASSSSASTSSAPASTDASSTGPAAVPGDGKGAPLPGFVWLAAVLVVGALRRRA